MLALAVTGGEAGDDLVRARDGLGVDHDDAGVEVAVPGHLGGAVGVGGPEMVVVDLAAIHVFPARVEEAAVGQRPGGVVVFVVAGDGADVAAVGVAAVHDRDLGEPAVDPALAARGDEDDVAVRQIGGLDIVVGAVGELAQAGAIGIDLVEVILLRAALAIAEEDLLAVVMDLGVADAAARVIEQGSELVGGEVQAVELGAFPPCLAIRVVGVIAEVGIPMAVGLVQLARGEDEVVHPGHRAGAELVEQGGSLVLQSPVPRAASVTVASLASAVRAEAWSAFRGSNSRLVRFGWFGQQRAEVVPKRQQLPLLLLAEGAEALGVGVHPRGQAVEAVGIELHVLVAAGLSEQLPELAVGGDGLVGDGAVALEGLLLKVVIPESSSAPGRRWWERGPASRPGRPCRRRWWHSTQCRSSTG